MRKLVYYKASPKPQTRRRRTNKPNLIRPILILSVFTGMVLSVGFFVYKAAPAVKNKINNFQQEGYTGWTFQYAEVSGLDGAAAKTVLDFVLFSPGQKVSAQDCKKLAKDLGAKILTIKDIKVTRGLMSGKLRISAKPRSAVAQLGSFSAIKQGFDEDGVVYPIAPDAKVPFVLISDDDGKVPQKVSKEIVQLVDAVSVFEKEVGFANLSVRKDGSNGRISDLKNTQIVLGPADTYAAQAKAAAKILKYTEGKYKNPIELNFEYFSNKKVYLKEIPVPTT